MVIRDSRGVALSSWMSRFPNGGIICTQAWGITTLIMRCRGLIPRATAASHWVRGTASSAPRTTSDP